MKKEVVEQWMREFKQAFIRTYWRPVGGMVKRAAEVISLLVYNKTVRVAAGALLMNARLVRQFFRIRLR